jgi:catechol 2,3-dioxygenase-like lactoylglutathione lyase family enzyme
MLKDNTVCAMVAVSDIEKAKEFYGGTLGLEQMDENQGGVAYKSGTGKVFVYQTPNAGTNKATSANWDVTDMRAVVDDLKSKGVEFEHYDFPGVEYDGDIHKMGPMLGAWFKDPDGNILGLSSM